MLLVLLLLLALSFLIGFCAYRPTIVLNWLNELLAAYSQKRAIFDTQNLPWAQVLRANHAVIRQEYEEYCRANRHYRPAVAELIPSERPAILGEGKSTWRVVYLTGYYRNTKVSKQFPETMKLLETTGCCSAFFSVLEPNVQLIQHTGYYRGVLRYHLGLIVPPRSGSPGDPACYLQVEATKLEWEEGKDLMFDDCCLHGAANHATSDRVILLLDVVRPLPPLLHAVNLFAIALARILPNQLVKRVNELQAKPP